MPQQWDRPEGSQNEGHHFSPEYYAQPEFQRHPNTAVAVEDVWISGPGAEDLASYIATVSDTEAIKEDRRTMVQTATGAIVLASAEAFEDAFGTEPPHSEDGPHLAGFTVGCRSLDVLKDKGLSRIDDRLVLPPSRGFGTAVAFRQQG